MTERAYQAGLIRRIKLRFPGCVLIKNDSSYQQGMLDWTFLHGDFWATLEVKATAAAGLQPNQEYFVTQMNEMSFAAFIYPENEEEVLDALEHALASRRRSCVS